MSLIECRSCDIEQCDGCNIKRLSEMLHRGRFNNIMIDGGIQDVEVTAFEHTEREYKPKSCPLCGGSVEIDSEQNFEEVGGKMIWRSPFISFYCKVCGLHTPYFENGNMDKLIEMWNKRV